MIIYKVAMQLRGTNSWIVMDDGKSESKLLEILESYRIAMPDRNFRLEEHTMKVLDV
jgi:hypothetical protein